MESRRRIVLAAAIVLAFAAPVLAHEGMQQQKGAEDGMTMQMDDPSVQPPRPPVSELKVLVSHFKQPEYLHVIVNTLPLLGMGLGAMLLMGGLWLKSDGIIEAGLALVVLAAIATLPTILLGQRAYDRLYNQIPMEGQQWLDVHMGRAEKLQWLFYLTGGLAAWALASSRRKKPSATRQAQASLAAAGLCAALAGWISHAGGQVTHSEFRLGPPMSKAKPMQESHRPTEP